MINIETKFQIESLTDLVQNAAEVERVVIEINARLVAIVPVEDSRYMESLGNSRNFQLAGERFASIDDILLCHRLKM